VNGREKFGTYFRDTGTGLDYANQRYHAPGFGRFMTVDPSMPGVADNPGSWNMYAYVEGDPVNLSDPTGLIACGDLPMSEGGTIRSNINTASDAGRLMRMAFHEGGTLRDADNNTRILGLIQGLMVQAILNRQALITGRALVVAEDGALYYGPGMYSGSHPRSAGAGGK
jgi:RHS repeat-associated protein